MADSLDDLNFAAKLDLDFGPFVNGVERAIRFLGDVEKAGTAAMQKIEGAGKSAGSAFQAVGAFSAKAFASIKTGASQAASLVGDMISKLALFGGGIGGILGGISLGSISQTAADMTEELARFDVVFGSFSSRAREFVEDFGASIGRSSNELSKFMTSSQILFTGMEFGSIQAAQLSEALTKLAVDVATFMNQDEDTVLKNLQNGVMGNAKAVRQYGVFLNEAAISQELLRLGIVGGAKAATEQEVAIARLNVIIRETSNAHGAAAADVGSFGNLLKQLQGIVTDLATEYGGKLNTAIVEAINSMGGWEPVRRTLEASLAVLVRVGGEVLALGAQAVMALAEWQAEQGGLNAILFKTEAVIAHISIGVRSVEIAAKTMAVGVTTVFNGIFGVVSTVIDGVTSLVHLIASGVAGALSKVAGAISWIFEKMNSLAGGGDNFVAKMANGMDAYADSFQERSEMQFQYFKMTGEEALNVWGEVGDSIVRTVDDLNLPEAFNAVEQSANRANDYWERAEDAARKYQAVAREVAQENDPDMLQPSWVGGASGYISPFARPTPGGYAEGGEVMGPSGRDRVPAMLTAGEFVVSRGPASRNRGLLRMLNAGGGTGSPSLPGIGGPTVNQNVTQNFYTNQVDPRAMAVELARLSRSGKRLGGM